MCIYLHYVKMCFSRFLDGLGQQLSQTKAADSYVLNVKDSMLHIEANIACIGKHCSKQLHITSCEYQVKLLQFFGPCGEWSNLQSPLSSNLVCC